MSNLTSASFITFYRVLFCLAFLVFGVAAPSSAGKIKRIILMETMPVPVVQDHSRWFLTQLRSMGYKEGENMRLVLLQPNGDRGRAESLLKEALAGGDPDLVVTNATLASQTAVRLLKGTGIPILFMTVSDPVGAGLIRKVGVPTGTHITGKVHMISRETRINMVMGLIGDTVSGKPVRIGFVHSSYPSSVGDLRELSAFAKSRDDIRFVPFQVDYRKVPQGMPAMLKDAIQGIETIRDQVDFWWEPSGPLGEVGAYTKALLEHSSAPVVMGTKLESVKLGALLHLTPSIEASGRETAMLADAILKGADPGSIPATPPTAFELGINLTTALENKIVVPPDLLELAGEHIYRQEQ